MKKSDLVKKVQKEIKRRQGQSRCIEQQEIKRVLKQQIGDKHEKRNICLITLGFYVGTRVGELSELKLGDVLNKDWTVKDTVVLRKEYTKTKQSRELFLTKDNVRKSIQDYVQERREKEGLDDKDFKKKLFKSQKGEGFSGRTLQRCLKNMFRSVGLDESCSSHSMRRTFVTNLFENGCDVKIVSKLVGHSNIQTTLNTYYTVRNDVLRDVTKNLVIR
jgi:integrase/recombinase XerD